MGRRSNSPARSIEVTVDISGKLIADTEEEKHVRAKVAMARQ